MYFDPLSARPGTWIVQNPGISWHEGLQNWYKGAVLPVSSRHVVSEMFERVLEICIVHCLACGPSLGGTRGMRASQGTHTKTHCNNFKMRGDEPCMSSELQLNVSVVRHRVTG